MNVRKEIQWQERTNLVRNQGINFEQVGLVVSLTNPYHPVNENAERSQTSA